MSDENKPKPVRKTSAVELRKTSAVPLRKETVRVTLKATPQDSKPPNAPPAPAPTIPLKTAGAALPQPPAPTIPLSNPAPTRVPAPAPTVKLGTPVTPAPATPGASSQSLPKATVPLQEERELFKKNAPIGKYLDVKEDADGQGATIVTNSFSKQEDVLSVIALLLALILLGVQLTTANIWVNDETDEAGTNSGWGKLFE